MKLLVLGMALMAAPPPTAALDDFLAGRWKELYARTSPALQSKLPAEAFISQMGPQIQSVLGTCKKPSTPPKVDAVASMQSYVYRLECEKQTIGLMMAVNAGGQLEGLRMVPPPVDDSGFAVVTGPYRLPAKLTTPGGDGPFPALVLVHGSGPNDMDETIGPNKVFRDIADGLAARGIATLRYEKRTRQYSTTLPQDLTLEGETIEDAISAAALLRKQPKIDPKRVFVLGHSLGAYAAPRIGKGDPSLRGLILLAGNTRPLEVLIDEQMKYLGQSPEMAAKVKAAMPDAYRKDLANYDPVTAAASLTMPMLILQGERDYQVTMADFEGWKKLASSRVTLRSFPKLNHLFMEGEGKGTPAEYRTPGAFSAEALDLIADWVKKQR